MRPDWAVDELGRRDVVNPLPPGIGSLAGGPSGRDLKTYPILCHL